LFGVSRDFFYKAQSRNKLKQQIDQQVLQIALEQKAILFRSGVVKTYTHIKPILLQKGIKFGRDKFYKLLKNNGLTIKRKRFKMPKTDSKHPFRKHKNLIHNLHIHKPDQVWVSDITYIKVGDKWNYLTLVTDYFSRKIMGFSFSKNMDVQSTSFAAMKMALNKKKSSGNTILHSDRGFQYCNPNFVNTMAKKGIIPSMTNNGNPYENAVAERINGILKYEFDLRFKFKNFESALKQIKKAIKLYNNFRLHWSLNLKTPNSIYLKHFNLF